MTKSNLNRGNTQDRHQFRLAGPKVLLIASACFVMIRLFACSSGSEEGTNAEASREYDVPALLSALAKHVIAPSYDQARSASFGLSQAVQALPADGATLNVVQSLIDERFKEMMNAWQQVEVMQLGPAGATTAVVAGENLRDEIYSWPTTNPCLIDQAIVNQSYAETDFLTTSLVNVRGLDALEYLLYYEGAENQCDARAEINNGSTTSPQWRTLTVEEITSRRRAYAKVLTDDLTLRVGVLAESWFEEEGSAYNDLVSAGDAGSSYSNVSVALNDLTHALFYIEEMTKDKKLGKPGGLCVDCQSPTWESGLELPWSMLSGESIAANLRGIASLYFGTVDLEAIGSDTQANANSFDAALRAMGEQQLADNIVSALSKAIDVVDNVPKPILNKVLSREASDLQTMYDAIKDLADLLKGDFATALLLEVPAEAASDAD